jgi:hypothetical protein
MGGTAGAAKAAKQHQSLSLLDRVWQVLGSSAETEDCLPLMASEGTGGPKLHNGHRGGENHGESEMESSSSAGLQLKDAVRATLSGGGGRQRKLGTAREPPPPVLAAAAGKEAADSASETGGGAPGWMTADSAHSSCCDPPFKDQHHSGGGGGRGGGGGGDVPPAHVLRQSRLRVGEDTVVDRCSTCGAIRERYSQVCYYFGNQLYSMLDTGTHSFFTCLFLIHYMLNAKQLYLYDILAARFEVKSLYTDLK